jgi:hypothetical protein
MDPSRLSNAIVYNLATTNPNALRFIAMQVRYSVEQISIEKDLYQCVGRRQAIVELWM